MEGLSISAIHVRLPRVAAEFWNRTRLGGGRPAASGQDRALSKRTRSAGAASAFQSGSPGGERRHQPATWAGVRAPEAAGEPEFLVGGQESFCICTRPE